MRNQTPELPVNGVLPALPGTYALILSLRKCHRIRIGSLGTVLLPVADYVYLGSALGPGGLRARVTRHIAGGNAHWHIDTLRAIAEIRGICFVISNERLECRWSKLISMQRGAVIPVSGFGSSDCAAHCEAHLVAFAAGMDCATLQSVLDQENTDSHKRVANQMIQP